MVYIIEFDSPVSGRAKFYIGWTRDANTFTSRMKHHKNGTGAALVREANKQKITWRTVVIVPDGTPADEKRWKSWKNTKNVVRALKAKGFGT